MEFPFFRVRESVWKFKFFILRSLWTINYRGAKLRLRKFEKADLKDSNLDIAGIQQIFSPRAFVFWVRLCPIVRISLRESSYSRIYSLLWNFWLLSNLQVIIGESPIRKRKIFSKISLAGDILIYIIFVLFINRRVNYDDTAHGG